MKLLGKTPAIFDRRTPKLSAYLDLPKLPPLPSSGSDWFGKVSKFNTAGNLEYGDCVVAGAAHMGQTWTANAGRHEVITPDQEVVKTYLKLTGGQDTGLNMLEFLNYWRKTGVFGNKIGAFVSVNPKKITQMQYACWLFGGVFTGFLLPLSAKDQEIWDVPHSGPVGKGEADTWGGHCAPIGYATNHFFKVATWGEVQALTAAFLATYCDEAYAVLSLDWFNVEHKTPAGFAYRDLLSDINRLVTA